jgi:hypothetical protein
MSTKTDITHFDKFEDGPYTLLRHLINLSNGWGLCCCVPYSDHNHQTVKQIFFKTYKCEPYARVSSQRIQQQAENGI